MEMQGPQGVPRLKLKNPSLPSSAVRVGCLGRKPSVNKVAKAFIDLSKTFTGTKEEVSDKIKKSIELTRTDLKRLNISGDFNQTVHAALMYQNHKYKDMILSVLSLYVAREEPHHHTAIPQDTGTVENPIPIATAGAVASPILVILPIRTPLDTLLESLEPIGLIANMSHNEKQIRTYFAEKGGLSAVNICQLLAEIDAKVDSGQLTAEAAIKHKVSILKVLNKNVDGKAVLRNIPLVTFNILRTYLERDRVVTEKRLFRKDRTKPLVSVAGLPTVVDNKRDLGKGFFGRARVVTQHEGERKTEIVAKKIKLTGVRDLLSAHDEMIASRVIIAAIREREGVEDPVRVLDILDCHFHIRKDGQPCASIYTQKYDGTLTQFLKESTRKERLQLFLEMSKAMAQFHAAGWAHEDIKADNFLVKVNKNPDGSLVLDAEGNQRFTVVVADLGMAHPMGTDPTLSSSVSWSQMGGSYPSKEAITLRSVSHQDGEKHPYQAHDVFSFGVELASLIGAPQYIQSHKNYTPTNPVYAWVTDTNARCDDLIAVPQNSLEVRQDAAMAALTKRCIADLVTERPTMAEVQTELERIYTMV